MTVDERPTCEHRSNGDFVETKPSVHPCSLNISARDDDVIAVTSAGAERSFSIMTRVKNYLRSIMSDKRLSNLCIISIEREISYKLLSDTRPVVDGFAGQRKRIG
jgi:hAT family C-terminal dimerisation region